MRREKNMQCALWFLILVCMPAVAQNSAVPWSAFDMGFAVPTATNTVVTSAVGQSFIGPGAYQNIQVIAGFLSGTQTLVSVREDRLLPAEFKLYQNYPNPFNPSTTVMFDLPQMSRVSIRLYNILGQEVAVLIDEMKEAGHHKLVFSPTDLASGAYFCRMQTLSFVVTKKIMVVR